MGTKNETKKIGELIIKLEDNIDYISKSTSWEVVIDNGELKKFKNKSLLKALTEADEFIN